MCKKKCIIAWAIVFIVISIIVFLTVQNSAESLKLSSKIQSDIVAARNRTDATQFAKWEYNKQYFRRLAHIVEYFVLGLAVCYALNCSLHIKIIKKSIIAIVFCMVVSVGDQLLKGLLPTREFDPKDLLYDFYGYMLGIGILMIILFSVLFIGRLRKK